MPLPSINLERDAIVNDEVFANRPAPGTNLALRHDGEAVMTQSSARQGFQPRVRGVLHFPKTRLQPCRCKHAQTTKLGGRDEFEVLSRFQTGDRVLLVETMDGLPHRFQRVDHPRLSGSGEPRRCSVKVQFASALVGTRAGDRAAAPGIRWAHDVQRGMHARPDTEPMYGTDTRDLRVQRCGLALLGIGVRADIDAAGCPSNVSCLQRGSNFACADPAAK